MHSDPLSVLRHYLNSCCRVGGDIKCAAANGLEVTQKMCHTISHKLTLISYIESVGKRNIVSILVLKLPPAIQTKCMYVLMLKLPSATQTKCMYDELCEHCITGTH
jgi:hypothetical protein